MSHAVSDPCPIPGVHLTPLKIIEGPLGTVLHGLKSHEPSFIEFGEVYFSTVKHQAIKSWRRHLDVTLNLVVPQGEIRFVLCDDRPGEEPVFWEVYLSRDNYQRLTVAPGIWLAFQGISEETNMLMDVIDLPHADQKSETKELEEIPYSWD
ncbi:MAG: dTDP-4-dehydrorhamnose 3,5-epimerase, partial [Cyanothece sp. SIO1E1]|nr:dTDP-4-dehydrorhamnose 3,5-epimerase [Cyanothece sp. SIO1E1]